MLKYHVILYFLKNVYWVYQHCLFPVYIYLHSFFLPFPFWLALVLHIRMRPQMIPKCSVVCETPLAAAGAGCQAQESGWVTDWVTHTHTDWYTSTAAVALASWLGAIRVFRSGRYRRRLIKLQRKRNRRCAVEYRSSRAAAAEQQAERKQRTQNSNQNSCGGSPQCRIVYFL